MFKEQKDARRRHQDREVEGGEKKGRKHERKKDGKESKEERETKRGEFPAKRIILGDRSSSMGIRVLLTFFPWISQQR